MFGISSVGTRCFAFLVPGGVSADVEKWGRGNTVCVEKSPGKIFGEAMHLLKAGFHDLVSLLTLTQFSVEGKSLGNTFSFSLLTDSAIDLGIHPSMP
jgi:hypothetical protein